MINDKTKDKSTTETDINFIELKLKRIKDLDK